MKKKIFFLAVASLALGLGLPTMPGLAATTNNTPPLILYVDPSSGAPTGAVGSSFISWLAAQIASNSPVSGLTGGVSQVTGYNITNLTPMVFALTTNAPAPPSMNVCLQVNGQNYITAAGYIPDFSSSIWCRIEFDVEIGTTNTSGYLGGAFASQIADFLYSYSGGAGTVDAQVIIRAGSSSTDPTASGFGDGLWHHLASGYDTTNEYCEIDGTRTGNSITSPWSQACSTNFSLGSLPVYGGLTYGVPGTKYKNILITSSPDGTTVVTNLYWLCNEGGTNTTVIDYSGNGYDGTLVPDSSSNLPLWVTP